MVGIVRKRSRRLPRKVGYTGLTTVQPQQQGQRGAYRPPTPTSRESIRRGPAQEEQNTGGLLGNALAGKQAVDTIGGMYEGGKDLREGFSGLGKAYDKTTDYLGDAWNNSMLGDATSQLSMPSMPDFLSGSATQASSIPLPTDFSMVDGTITSLGGDVVGMTMPRECKLAAEREIPYSALLIASNWAAGRDPDDSSKDLDHHEVSATAAQYLDSVVDCILAVLEFTTTQAQ